MKLRKTKEKKKTELEQVEERREEILAQGRKFKYPLQWTRHRVVINTILIALIVVAIVVVGGWLALYQFKSTDELLYRSTLVVPVAVAKVDGESVRFSDYLMLYRSSILAIERQTGQLDNEENAKAVRAQYKRVALTEAEEYTYALKLAKETGVSVSQEEINTEFERHRKIGGIDRSEEAFLKIIEDNFGLSRSEYDRLLYLTLLRAKVEVEIDTDANNLANKIESALASNSNYAEVAGQFEGIKYEETGGLVDSKNIDGGRASEAMKLSAGESSGRFVSINGDGYYFVKLIEKTDAKVNFVSIKVPFTEFDKRFAGLVSGDAIKEYITLE